MQNNKAYKQDIFRLVKHFLNGIEELQKQVILNYQPLTYAKPCGYIGVEMLKKVKVTADRRSEKILTVGNTKSGKSCLLIRKNTKSFPFGYVPNVSNSVCL